MILKPIYYRRSFNIEGGKRKAVTPYAVSGMGFFGYILRNHQPLLINENMKEAVVKYQNVYSSSKGLPKSVLFMPLMTGDAVHGVVVLKNMRKEQAFIESDVRLLKTLANAMSIALENARLWEQEELYRKALEREFEIGREIQASFLPESLPQPKGWEIAALLKSAREVSGDFYDAFELTEGMVGLVIADVCDKGLGAALFMTLFRSLIRAVSNIDFFTNAKYQGEISLEMRLKNAMSLTNNYIADTHGNTSMFCSIFFGILDTRTGKLTYINGGHLPPRLINRQGLKEILQVTGPLVGITPGIEYVTQTVIIEKGDTFFAHTDGLTDTMSPAGEYFNDEELIPLFVGDQPLGLLLEKIQDQVDDFSAGVKQSDDITLLAVRRKIR